MMRRLMAFGMIVSLLMAAVLARGQGFGLGGLGVSRGSGEKVTARAAVSADPLVPGKDAEIGVEVRIDPRYHIQSAYAEKGLIAAALEVKPVSGLTFGKVHYAKAKDIAAPPGNDTPTLSVYEGTVYFLVPVTVNADAAPGERTVELSLTSQACDDKTCDAPTTKQLKVPVKIAAAGANQSSPDAALFEAAHKQEFGPLLSASTTTKPDNVTTTTSVTALPAGPGRPVHLLSTEEQLALIAQRNYQPFNAAEHEHSVAAIFLLALVGGLILNVMPCVLPVIPLKALSLVQQAHGDRRLAVVHGLAFTAGVITLFIALAVLLRGFGLFYGQQFQSPVFLITMTMFVVALALSMLGVWTINPPQIVYKADAIFSEAASGGSGMQVPPTAGIDYAGPATPQHRSPAAAYVGSFGNGLMATLLATPCSAPFLGGVLAWALVQPAWLTAIALATVGLGMSLPYLLLAIFPGLLSRFPRAGRWSELLKQGLGIVMLGVAVYLVTLVPNVQLWPWVLIGGVVTALACWGWGQIPSPAMNPARIWTIRIIVLAIGLLLGLGVYKVGAAIARSNTAMMARASSDSVILPEKFTGEWLPFNVALVDEALKDGRPVVVDWTADWCPNCHALEALVLSREAVQQAFAGRNAVLLRADLSADNPPATALNHKLGGEAIPVLAIFSPSRPTEPVVLRDSYSQARVIGEVTGAR
jgi:suppressor for copper-sensitivity B